MASSASPVPMLPNRSPSTWRAFGTRAPIFCRNKWTPLEPPVKNTVSMASARTPASRSKLPTVSSTVVTQMLNAGIEVAAFQLQRLRWRQTIQLQFDRFIRRQGNLAGFYLQGQPVAGTLFHQIQQPAEFLAFADFAVDILQLLPRLARINQVDRVPGRQVEVIPGWHFAVAVELAAQTQQRHDAGQAQIFIEIGAADMYPAGGQDIVAPFGFGRPLRRQTQQGKVRGAAADIGDQDQFFTINAGLVVESGGNRFKLKIDMAEADRTRDIGQGILRQLIGRRIVIDKIHRPAQHHAVKRVSAGTLGAFA